MTETQQHDLLQAARRLSYQLRKDEMAEELRCSSMSYAALEQLRREIKKHGVVTGDPVRGTVSRSTEYLDGNVFEEESDG